MGSIAKKTSVKVEKYLDKTSLVIEIGEVIRTSIVPFLNSSANKRMVRAGMKTKNKKGDRENKPFICVNPESRMLKSPEKSHKKAPFVSR